MTGLIIGIIVVFIGGIGINTIRFKSKRQREIISLEDSKVDVSKAIEKFAEGIRIPTVSFSDYSKVDWGEFKKFREYLKNCFPWVHEKMEMVIINEHSIIFKWIGKDMKLDPILFTAHQDVVPVEDGTDGDWAYDAFSGAVEEGFIWGRGTLDTKVSLIASLEAAEELLKKEYKPDRSIYFAFGHDEEVGGKEGAVKIAEYFEKQGTKFYYVLDEGGCFVNNGLPGVEGAIGYLGIGEKGYANIEINVKGTGGHASMPPKNTSMGELAKIITRLEKNQMRMKVSEPVKSFLSYVGPEMSFVNRILLANMWIFGPVVKKGLSKNNSGNALLRTTTAVTMAKGSMEPNVLPQTSTATFNFRIGMHDSCEMLLKHIKKHGRDIDYSINALRLEEPSKVSRVNSEGFKLIEKIAYGTNKEALVVPYIVMAGTDARKYEELSRDIYRFTPYIIEKDDLNRIHSTNERISIENYKRCIDFYYNLIINNK